MDHPYLQSTTDSVIIDFWSSLSNQCYTKVIWQWQMERGIMDVATYLIEHRTWHILYRQNERFDFYRTFLQRFVWATHVNFRSYLEDYVGYGLQLSPGGAELPYMLMVA